MDKRTLIAGLIVLAIGIALGLAADNFLYSIANTYPHSVPHLSKALYYFAFASLIIGGLLIFAGIILIIYAFMLPDPPVHWDNDL